MLRLKECAKGLGVSRHFAAITDLCARKPGFIHATVALFDKTYAQATAGSTDDVLRLIAGGLSNQRIAQRLDITPETVKSHTKSIFARLAARTRATYHPHIGSPRRARRHAAGVSPINRLK